MCTVWGLPLHLASSDQRGRCWYADWWVSILGVEIGQLLFVAVFLPPLIWLTRARGARLAPRIASLTVATIGTYWLVDRIFVG